MIPREQLRGIVQRDVLVLLGLARAVEATKDPAPQEAFDYELEGI
jgi:hypothetical protein